MAKKLSKRETDHYLYGIAKKYKKMNRTDPHAELIIVGGGAIMLGYNFRDATDDLDTIIRGSASLIKEIANSIGDENGLADKWLNSDFSSTASYSKELIFHSKFYKTFCNCLDVRIVSDEYLVAMKMVSGRPYKNDRSDIIGILAENIQRGTPISYEQIDKAVTDLYGGWQSIQDGMEEFLHMALESDDLEELYYAIAETEEKNRHKLLDMLEKDPDLNSRIDVAFSYLDGFVNAGTEQEPDSPGMACNGNSFIDDVVAAGIMFKESEDLKDLFATDPFSYEGEEARRRSEKISEDASELLGHAVKKALGSGIDAAGIMEAAAKNGVSEAMLKRLNNCIARMENAKIIGS